MRIAKLEDFHADGGWRKFSFLKLTTDEGLVGWAEYAENFGAGGVSELIQRFAGIVKGMDPRAVGRISASLHATTRLAAGGLNNQAIAAIENACLDVKAKALGIPVHSLFGGPVHDRLPVYWSHFGSFRMRFADFFEKEFGLPAIRTPEDVSQLAREARERGFKAVKTNPVFFGPEGGRMFDAGFRIAPGFLNRNITDGFINASCQMLEAVRDGLGDDGGIMFDLNFSHRTEGLRRVAKAIEPYHPTWMEADIHDPQALAMVRASSSTPIASLESIHGLSAYRPYFEAASVDVAIIDVPWNGMLESYRIATLADAFEVNVAPHNFYGDLATLMSAHLGAAIPNFRILETEIDDVPWKSEFLTHPPRIENGELIVPDGPGWGSDINEEAVKARPPRQR